MAKDIQHIGATTTKALTKITPKKTKLTRSQTKVIEIANDIRHVSAFDADMVGFSHVYMQTMLPSSEADPSEIWHRKNGRFSLFIQSGEELVDGEIKLIGLPYGNIPRLLLLWIISEAQRTRSPELHMGRGLGDFMKKVGITRVTGGRNGNISRFKDQARRLFNARVRFVATNGDEHEGIEKVRNFQVADEYQLAWSSDSESNEMMLESLISLNNRFYKQIIEHSTPIDLRVVRAVKQSPLALDLYTWLTFRMNSVSKPTYISWQKLHENFGADYKQAKHFGSKARQELAKILQLYDANVSFERGRIVLRPSKTHVPKLNKK